MTIRVIDIETTGTDSKKDKIIEIASIDLTRDYNHNNAIETLIDIGDTPIPPESMAVHHIIPSDLKQGIPLDKALSQFAGANCYVAHNAPFEISFLPDHWGPWIDTLKCAMHMWPEAPGYSNQVLRYWLGIYEPFSIPRHKIAPHRALSDVLVTGSILVQMFRAGAKYKQLIDWSEQPKPIKKMPFGKHSGELLENVPTDYFEWLVEKSQEKDANIDPDLIYHVENILAERVPQKWK